MTLHDLYGQFLDAGAGALVVLYGLPLLFGLASLAVKFMGQRELSQDVANVGIAVGLAALCLEALGLGYAVGVVDLNPLETTPLSVLLLGPTLVVGGFIAEHLVHPGRQEAIRQQLRNAGTWVIVLGVVLFLLGRLRVWLMIHVGILGFLVFILLIIGFFVFLLRRAV